MIERETAFGTVAVGSDSVGISATQDQLQEWALRTGWPCSNLSLLSELRCSFAPKGLDDLEGDSEHEVGSDEFNAWSSDVLRGVLSKEHACWFVTVGQFERKE